LRILVSNDDGYFAPGLAALAQAMQQFGEVVVVAPDQNKSGASSSLTLDRPLSISKKENGFYAVNGTPTDCVHIALTGLGGAPFDLVVSGINSGPNMGDDTIYSGTVAAATEAFLFGLSAIAFSSADWGSAFLPTAAAVAARLVDRFRVAPLTEPMLLNVNVPACTLDQLGADSVTRLGKRHTSEPVVLDKNPRGDPIYWIGAPGAARDAAEGTDFHAVANRCVSITPLQIDLTAPELMPALSSWLGHR
jgi:5'-nucleotidase